MTTKTGSHPLVSVIVIIYRPHLPYLRRAIESILSQTLSDFELIVVESPSLPCASDLLRTFSDSRLRHVVNREGSSVAIQRNVGLRFAKGNFIAVMDGDDIAQPLRLATQVAFLEANADVHVVGSHIAAVDAEDRVVGYRYFPLTHESIARALRRFVPLCHPSVMVRRGVIEKHGGYSAGGHTVATDYDLWSRLIRNGVRFANIDDVLLRYRLHSGQVKATHVHDMIRSVLTIKQRYWISEMNTLDRLRMTAEKMLLCVPKPVTRWLVTKALYCESQRSSERVCAPRRPVHVPFSCPTV